MSRRMAHGRRRHKQGDRPTKEAFHDRDNPREIYLDIGTGYQVYVGAKGRTHIFTQDGRHHTSYRTTAHERQGKVRAGRWIRQSQGEA